VQARSSTRIYMDTIALSPEDRCTITFIERDSDTCLPQSLGEAETTKAAAYNQNVERCFAHDSRILFIYYGTATIELFEVSYPYTHTPTHTLYTLAHIQIFITI
jgi:hypothetical protein